MESPDKNITHTLDNIINKISIKDIVLKYVSYLPLFILSVIICYTTSHIYIRYTTPIYRATGSMLVKNTSSGNSASNVNGSNFLQNALFGNAVNLDNELELIRSKSLIERAIKASKLNINYYSEGALNRLDVYRSTLFTCDFIVSDSSIPYNITVKNINQIGGEISTENNSAMKFKWDDTLLLKGFNLVIKKRKKAILPEQTSTDIFKITWQPFGSVAGFIQSRLSVGMVGKTTIVQLGIRIENPFKGEDILNAIITEYQKVNMEIQLSQALATQRFINERLDTVKVELRKLENKLMSLQDSTQMLDLNNAYELYRGQKRLSDKIYLETETKLNILGILEKSIQNAKDDNAILPINLLEEANNILNPLIGQYNADKNEYQRIKLIQSENSQYVEEVLLKLNRTLNKIRETIPYLKEKIANDLKSAQKKDREADDFINKFSEKNNHTVTVKREKETKEQLFLYLLQKSEEAGIAAVSSNSGYQQIDKAISSNIPVEPKPASIRTFSTLVGLIIPILIIFLIDLFNDRVTTKQNIVEKLKSPVVGEIGHKEETKTALITNNRSLSAEQFRVLRSNLSFLLAENKNTTQTILVTSSISGEGKSFVSLNLAAVLTLAGNKVALMEFDLRKMSRLKEMNNIKNQKGITNYLINQVNEIDQLYYTTEDFPDLHIFGSGPIPPNPAELLLGERVKSLIKMVQEKYDYVILDSAPIGLVSDSYAIAGQADLVLYIIRQRYTLKKQVDFIREIEKDGKFKNLALIANDVRLGGRYGYYGYNYGYSNAYNYGYAYGALGNYFGKNKNKNGDYFDTEISGKRKWWQLFKKS